MSLYRFVRTSAMLALAGRYRAKLFRIAVAIGIALVTAWLFDDVAQFLERHRPEWLGPALIIKTLVVYGALVYGFWLLRPGSWQEAKADAVEKQSVSRAGPKVGSPGLNTPGPLDELVDKPSLRSRKAAILDGEGQKKP
jgi:hypothetical protein